MPHPNRRWLSDLLKRSIDIIVSSFGLLLLAPIFVYLVWRIRRDSPGPAFYRGRRAGRNSKVFNILKFRTMYECPESYEGPSVTAHDDPRITPLGKWLRETKLNELPQLWNVLKGDMSLVGPRPEAPEITVEWPEKVRRDVLSVRPGVTSPASVQFRNEEALLDNGQVMDTYMEDIVPSKLRLDQLYVRHRSFLLDLDVLFWTLLVLFPLVNAYSPPEDLLFVGPFSRLGRSYAAWFISDMVTTFIAIGITGVIFRSFGPLDLGLPLDMLVAAGFAVLFSTAGALLGLPRISWSRAGLHEAFDLTVSTFLASLVAFLANIFLPGGPFLPPAMIIMSSILAFAGFVGVRYRARLLQGLALRWLAMRSGARGAQERVLIVGGGESGQFAAWLLGPRAFPNSFKVVGFVDDDLFKQNTRIHGLTVVGRSADIPTLVEAHDVGVIVFAIHNITAEERRRLLEVCCATPARVVAVPDVIATLTKMIKSSDYDASSLIGELSGRSSAKPVDHVPRQQVEAWLDGLEIASRSGDLASLQAHIRNFRTQLQGDAATQLAVERIEEED